MVVIEVKPEDKERVFKILIGNGLFRGLEENKFDIIENEDIVLMKLKKEGIVVKIVERSKSQSNNETL